MIPRKLQPGDEIRVIAPSMSLGLVSPEVKELAMQRLKILGLKISFSKHSEEIDDFSSSSIQSRVEDLHAAFHDKEVKGILSVLGGFNSNQLLRYLDFDLIEKNPKVFCGYSDITALQNAIFAKTSLVTYSGPHFSTFGCLKGVEFILDYFKRCLFDDTPFYIEPSQQWSDDSWYLDQHSRTFIKNEGFWMIQKKEVKGVVLGGEFNNIPSFAGDRIFSKRY